MKKTLKTAMTSAMFAAAVGVSAGSMPVGSASAQSAGAAAHPAEESLSTQTTTTDLQLGGDVPIIEETTVTTEELTLDGVAPIPEETTVTTEELMLGGDIPIIEGDLNYDFRVDARDLTLLKRMILENEGYSYGSDLNGDGVTDKEDVKALRRILTGKSKAEEDAEEAQTTTTAVTDQIQTNLTTVTEAIPVPLYGPPPVTEQTTDVTKLTTDQIQTELTAMTETLPAALYGPPSWFE